MGEAEGYLRESLALGLELGGDATMRRNTLELLARITRRGGRFLEGMRFSRQARRL